MASDLYEALERVKRDVAALLAQAARDRETIAAKDMRISALVTENERLSAQLAASSYTKGTARELAPGDRV